MPMKHIKKIKTQLGIKNQYVIEVTIHLCEYDYSTRHYNKKKKMYKHIQIQIKFCNVLLPIIQVTPLRWSIKQQPKRASANLN